MCPSALLLIFILGAIFLIYILMRNTGHENYVTQHILGNQIILKKHAYDDGMWSAYPHTL